MKKLMGSRLREEFPEVERSAQRVAQAIGGAFPPGWGFALLVFSYGAGGYCTHISSCQRDDLIKLLRETADTLEANRMEPPGVVGQKD